MRRKHSITAWLFYSTQIAALLWVTFSYLIAGYSTVFLGTPFPVETLSQEAIRTLLGAMTIKVVGNIFEHNNGKVFGTSDSSPKIKRDC